MSDVAVSIIIVQYKNGREIHRCLDSIADHTTGTSYEIIIVDNEGNQLLKDQLQGQQKITYLQTGANLGYGAGNNYGVKHAAGDYILILNPDIELKTNVIQQLYNFLEEHKSVGVVAPTLFDEAGHQFEFQGSKLLTPWSYLMSHTVIHRLFPKNPVAQHHYAINQNRLEPIELDAVPGAAFMIGKKLFNQIGKFDERIFLFFEEYDLGRRVLKAGKSLCILPDAQVVHAHHEKNKSVLTKFYRQSRKIYFQKYYSTILSNVLELTLLLLNWRFWLVALFTCIVAVIAYSWYL